MQIFWQMASRGRWGKFCGFVFRSQMFPNIQPSLAGLLCIPAPQKRLLRMFAGTRTHIQLNHLRDQDTLWYPNCPCGCS